MHLALVYFGLAWHRKAGATFGQTPHLLRDEFGLIHGVLIGDRSCVILAGFIRMDTTCVLLVWIGTLRQL